MGKRARRAHQRGLDATAAARPNEPENEKGEGGFVWLFLGILLLVPIVPWPFLHWNHSTFEIFAPAEKLAFSVLTLTASLFALRGVRAHFRHLTVQPLDLALFLLYMYFALSVSWSSSPPVSRDAGMIGLCFLLFYALAKHAVLRKDMVDSAIPCIHIAVALNNLYAIGQLCGFSLMLFGAGEEPIGLLGNRNHLAYFLALTLPIGLFRGWTTNRALHKAGLWNFYVSLVVLWFTGCRGGLLAGLVTLACFHAFKRKQDVAAQRVRKPMPPLVRGAIGVGVGVSLILMVGVGLYMPQKLQSVQARVFTWKLTLAGANETPIFGHGAGTFGNGYQEVQARYFAGLANDPKRLERGKWRKARHNRQAHNEYLQVYFELGGLGLALFLLTIGIALREFLGSYLAHGNLERIRLYPLFGSMLIGGLVEAFFGFPFQVLPTAMLITFALAVVSALSLEEKRANEQAETPDDPEEQLPPWAPAFFYIPYILMAGYVLNDSLAQWQAEGAYFRGVYELHSGNFPRAEEELKHAVELHPADGRAWNDLGQAQFLQSRYDEARGAFQRAGELYLQASVKINLGCVEAARGQMDGARRQFEDALAMDPFSTETHYRLGHLQATLRQFSAAEQSFKRAMSVGLGDFKVACTYARVLADMGKGAEAEKQFRDNVDLLKGLVHAEDPSGQTIEVTKRHWLAQNLLSLAAHYEREKKPVQAKECYDEARVYDRSVRPVEGQP